jgi:metal-sulfur cluster biosynthetic enzyme
MKMESKEETNPPIQPRYVWDIDKTHPEMHTDLEDMLASVMDPELGLTIIELGLVRNIWIADGKGHVKMILTTPFCPFGPSLLEAARVKAEKVLGVPTEVEFSTEFWDPTMMDADSQNSDWGLLP